MGGSDYYRNSGTFTISAGQDSANLNVTVLGDRIAEGNENFSLVITSATNATLAGGAAALVATGTILESGVGGTGPQAQRLSGPAAARAAGAYPTLDVRGVSVFEGDTSSNPAQFLFSLDRVATAPVTVYYYLQDETASSRSNDYYGDSGSITIQAGQQSAFLNATVLGDTANEGQERFKLIVADISGGVFAGNAAALTATATIIDGDDGATGLTAGIGGFSDKIYGPAAISAQLPTLRLQNASGFEGNTGSTTLRFLVTFDRALTAPATVNYTVEDGRASAGSGDFYQSRNSVTFEAGGPATGSR